MVEFEQTQIHHQDGEKMISLLVTLALFSSSLLINTLKVSLVNAVKSLCAHIISLTNSWNLTKLAQIHRQDRGKK